MDKYDVSNFLKEQRKKTDDDYYRETEKKKISSARLRDEPYEEPSNTIMIRGLYSDITEDDIKLSLDDFRANYIAVRLIKDRRSTSNKCIAFVEFIAVNDAKDVMYDTRGELYISGYYWKLAYGYNVKEEVDRYDAEKSNSWKHEKPTNTVMLRGVSSTLSDNEVRSYVSEVSKHVVDVRLIRDKKTGMSRGFGFVEFDSAAEAQRWMEFQQGYFLIDDVEMKLTYTSTRQGSVQVPEYFTTDSGDWSCARCGGHNFKRREFCYKCHLSKIQSKSVMETLDGKDQIGSSPCNTVIMRDLDALTQEDDIIKALRLQFNCNIRQCEIMHDEVTKVSRCFAFVELGSLSESRKIVEFYEDNPNAVFELSGKAVTIDFAKNNFNTLMASYKEALTKRFEETYEPPTHETSNYDANAAAAVAQAALNNKKNNKKGGNVSSSNVLPSNVIVESNRTSDSSALCFELIVNGQRCTSVPTNPFNMANINETTFVTPDTSKFLYDQSTQYYFDSVTGLYYDANSQYFFDRMSQKYVYWDPSRSKFISRTDDTTPGSEANVQDNTGVLKDSTVVGSGKKNKASEAKKIAKEMERWEKMMNNKKDSSHNCSTASVSAKVQPCTTATADSGFCMLSDNTRSDYGSTGNTRVHTMTADDLVATGYNSDSDPGNSSDCVVMIPSPDETRSPKSVTDVINDQSSESSHTLLSTEEAKLIDYDKMACLLCNRGFKDRATLDKHRSVSDLHKKNIETLKDNLGIPRCTKSLNATESHKMKYRDRAKERREKFGIPSPPPSSSKRKYEAEMAKQQQQSMSQSSQPVSAPPVDLSADGANIGSKLMAKMGWQHGQGLGKLNQGRTEIIQAEFVARGAGIGAAPRMAAAPTDNYRENLRRAMYAKYHDM